MRDLTPQRPVQLFTTHLHGASAVDNIDRHNKAFRALLKAEITAKELVFYSPDKEPQLWLLVDSDNAEKALPLIPYRDDSLIELDYLRIASIKGEDGKRVVLGTLVPRQKVLIDASVTSYFVDPANSGTFVIEK